MPGAGTDKTRNWVETPGPLVVLVEPQLGENIGAAARAMANFGLGRMRLVAPRQGWPNERAHVMAAGADRVLDRAEVFPRFGEAVADCSFVVATTARAHDQAKPVISAEEAARELGVRVAAGETCAILFGRERIGLTGEEVALADRILTLPVNPAFASLNLAQAVAIVSYEWFKHASAGALPFTMPQRSPPASKQQMMSFFAMIGRELDRVEFFRPEAKRSTMLVNLQNIFARMQPTQQDMQTLSGIVAAIAQGPKGPARGGILDSDEAARLRALIAEHGEGRAPTGRTPVRGLAKLLRRNPTEAERTLWDALTRDRRFAGRGFMRQAPVGPHVLDMVSFRERLVVDIAPERESAEAAAARADKRAWLRERNYRIVDVAAADVAADVGAVLDRLAKTAGEKAG